LAAGATSIILRNPIGIGQSNSLGAWIFSRLAAARRDSPLATLAASDDISWQQFSRLSFRLNVGKIGHNSAFLMKA
jgi:hypothetical protein